MTKKQEKTLIFTDQERPDSFLTMLNPKFTVLKKLTAVHFKSVPHHSAFHTIFNPFQIASYTISDYTDKVKIYQ